MSSKGLKLLSSPPKSRRSVDASNDMKTRRNDNTVSVGLSFQRVSPLLRRGISHDANPGKPLGNQSDRLDLRRSSGPPRLFGVGARARFPNSC